MHRSNNLDRGLQKTHTASIHVGGVGLDFVLNCHTQVRIPKFPYADLRDNRKLNKYDKVGKFGILQRSLRLIQNVL